MKTISYLVCFSAILLVFSGCRKLDNDQPAKVKLNEIQVSQTFDWKTSKDVVFYLTGYASNLAKVVSPSGTVYQTVFLNQKERMKVKVTVPAYESKVRLMYMGQDIEIQLTGNDIEYIFN